MKFQKCEIEVGYGTKKNNFDQFNILTPPLKQLEEVSSVLHFFQPIRNEIFACKAEHYKFIPNRIIMWIGSELDLFGDWRQKKMLT